MAPRSSGATSAASTARARAADGALVAVAATGDCSIVYLIANSEPRLPTAAKAVRG